MAPQEIIGYHDHYKDVYEHSIINGKKQIDRPANDVARFFSNEQSCPFCKTNLVTTFLGSRHTAIGVDLSLTGEVQECPNCGWWTLKTHFSEENDGANTHSIYTDTKYYGISKSFRVDDNDLPIHVLNTELIQKPDLLYAITPRKLEELVQDILRGIYDCEVLHVGKRGDGGKDLVVLNSDSPIFVQVKQRQSPNHVELVKGIRELVGTMYIEDARKGIFVSTAKRYSRGSINTAQQLLDSRKLDYFDLIDYDKLCQLIANRPVEKPWKPLVQEFYTDSHASVLDTPEKIQDMYAAIKELEEMYLK